MNQHKSLVLGCVWLLLILGGSAMAAPVKTEPAKTEYTTTEPTKTQPLYTVSDAASDTVENPKSDIDSNKAAVLLTDATAAKPESNPKPNSNSNTNSNPVISFEVVSLGISKIDAKSQFTLTGYIPFEKIGSNLTLRVYSDNTKIYAIDESQSKLSSFADDRGLNLISAGEKVDADSKAAHPNSFYYSTEKHNGISSVACNVEKNECYIKLSSDATPTPDANALNIKAEFVVLSMGDNKQEAELQNVTLKPKAKFSVPPYSIQLNDVGVLTIMNTRYQIFEFESPIKIESITLTTSDGKSQEVKAQGVNQFQIKEELLTENNLKMKISYYTPKPLAVPVEFSVGLGLSIKDTKVK
jgi:hypothetical protein